MTLFIIFICAAIAYAAYRYNTRYIEAQALAEEQQSVFTIGNEERQAWANRLVAEIEDAKAEREAPIHDRKVERLQFVIGSAEEKVEQERKAIYHLQDKLNSLNEKMKAIDTNIEFYRLANKVDAEIAERDKKEKLEDKIFNLKEKIRNHKERINKAQFTRRQAVAELDEIA